MHQRISYILLFITAIIMSLHIKAQTAEIKGSILLDGKPAMYATVAVSGQPGTVVSDSAGKYHIRHLPAGIHILQITGIGFDPAKKTITLKPGEIRTLQINLLQAGGTLNQVVVTGTMKAVSRLESPVPVEVYSPAFFKKNPTPNIYESLQNINGIRPQLNCQVCNTGDIHINGLEGPYTMILIDGMPIVSSLSSVYGLSGIPNSLVERIEIVKGPASSLYGSEAVGGLINIITKRPVSAPHFSADFFGTSWGEYNADIGFKLKAGKKTNILTGINYFNFQQKKDYNNDHFTDMTLQHRVSVFQKWGFDRKKGRLMSIAARFMYEDRWGGDLRWQKKFRGGDSIYGESIYTNRLEIIGNYQLPVNENISLSFSFNQHDQNSVYGTTPYMALQKIAFTQLTWDKKKGKNDFLLGTSLRYTHYDDNTTATSTTGNSGTVNHPQRTWLPGVFIQDEIAFTSRHKLLLGLRYDYNSYHGNIYTPRFAYKWTMNGHTVLRLNAGTGFRVVNLFTEEHASLTGARTVEILHSLKPEKSYNINVNFNKRFFSQKGQQFSMDASIFYTYFNNRIVADYETDPNKIIYQNLSGYAESRGVSLNADLSFTNGLKILAGATYMENPITRNGIREQQMLTEKMTGTWAISYKHKKTKLSIDYTGNIYSPMRLPVLGPTDPRASTSPWWSIQNIQLSFEGFSTINFYGGIKNFLNWTPNKGNPFIIARTNDPFDKEVQFDASGQAIATTSNPYGLTFDPSYVYAPNQGARIFIGMRYSLK